MNTMKYKDFIAKIEFSEEDDLFIGKVININDSITFHGTSKDELRQAFATMIDDYLIICENEGVEPNKPFSGSFNIRITPEMHRQLAIKSALESKSINQLVKEAISRSLTEGNNISYVFNFKTPENAISNVSPELSRKHFYPPYSGYSNVRGN